MLLDMDIRRKHRSDGDLDESIKRSASDRLGDLVPQAGSSPDFSRGFSRHGAPRPFS